MSLFQVNAENIKHLKRCIKAHGPHWLHGDGNVYQAIKQEGQEELIHPSDFHKRFSNPRPGNLPPAASYRVLFQTVESVPDDIETINRMLLEAANKETVEAGAKTFVRRSGVKVVAGDENEEPAKETQAADVKSAEPDTRDQEIADLKAQLEALKAQAQTKAPERELTDDEKLQAEIEAEEAAKNKAAAEKQ